MLDELRPLSPEAAAKRYLEQRETVAGLRPDTIDIYAYALASFLLTPDLPPCVADLRPEHWDDWVASMRRAGKKPGGIHTYQRAVRTWLRWLYRKGFTERLIHERVEMIRLRDDSISRRTATPDIYRAIVAAAREGHQPLRDVAMIDLMWAAGLRRSEVAGLDIADIDLKDNRVIVRTSKTGRPRVAAFTDRAATHLRDFIRYRRGEAPGSLFDMTPHAISSLMDRLAKRAGVTVSAHDLRRGMASRLREDGVELGAVMTLMGHTDPRQTAVYSRVGEAAGALKAYRRWAAESA